jgi:hypothetical protein
VVAGASRELGLHPAVLVVVVVVVVVVVLIYLPALVVLMVGLGPLDPHMEAVGDTEKRILLRTMMLQMRPSSNKRIRVSTLMLTKTYRSRRAERMCPHL